MKLALTYIAGSRESYADEAERVLSGKINAILPFQSQPLKARVGERSEALAKQKAESEKILASLREGDFVWLFDEKGQLAKDSREYSRWFVQALASGKQRIVMVIGGPYGFTDELRNRAQRLVSLSPLTMNHHVAKIAAMEQTYRALAIWKNLPYHN